MGTRNEDRFARYWKANRRLIGGLLLVWAFVSLGCGILLANPLSRVSFSKLPLAFWIAQQGAIYVFVLLIFIYAWRMDRIDHRYHADED